MLEEGGERIAGLFGSDVGEERRSLLMYLSHFVDGGKMASAARVKTRFKKAVKVRLFKYLATLGFRDERRVKAKVIV